MRTVGSLGHSRDAAQAMKPASAQKVPFTDESAQATFQAGTIFIKLFATEDCWIKIATNPTAVADDGYSFFLPAGIVEYFVCNKSSKLAVIRDSADGDLHITEGDIL